MNIKNKQLNIAESLMRSLRSCAFALALVSYNGSLWANVDTSQEISFKRFLGNAENITRDLDRNELGLTQDQSDHKIGFNVINRKRNLEVFFEHRKSPLVDNVDTFIEVADKYGFDYRFLPAIACLESGCGKVYIPDSKNPFGWGVYGNNYIKFDSFDHAIEGVGEGLYKHYVLKGADTPAKIAPIYNPPNPVKWLQNVNYFMNQIERQSAVS